MPRDRNPPRKSTEDLTFWRELDALRLREEQLNLILEGVQDHAITLLDVDGRIVTWNATAERIKGHALDDVRGKHFSLLFPEEDRLARLPERELEVAKRVGKFQGEGPRLRKDGSRFFASVSLSAVRDDTGELRGFVKVTHDITARVRAQRGVVMLSEASLSLASSFDEGQMLADFSTAVTREFAEFVVIDVDEEDGTSARQISAVDARKRAVAERCLGVLERRHEPGITKVAAVDDSHRATSVMTLPLAIRDRQLGHITVGNESQTFDDDALEIGLELARRLSLALDNARLFRRVREDQLRLDTALEAGRLGAWEWDIEKKRVTWSPALEEIHGLPRGSFGGTYEDYIADIHPEDRDRVLGRVKATLESGAPQYNLYRIIRPDGKVRWLETHGALIYDRQGKPSRLTGVCSDVTERKEAQDRLAESERRFRAVFDGALDAMVIADEERRFIDVNPAACAILGRSRESLIGTLAPELYVSAERAQETWRKIDGGTGRGETQLRRADGSLVDIEFSARKNIIPGRHLGVWRDVASRKRAESLLAFLAEASMILARTRDYRVAIRAVAELAVPLVSDWVSVELLDPDGTFRSLALVYADKAKEAELRAIRDRFPPSLDDPYGAGRAVRTGETEVRDLLSRDLLSARVRDSAMLETMVSMSPRALACIPLSPRGKVVGAISFVSAISGRPFSPSDIKMVEDLALRIGLAIDNAMLLESEQSARMQADLANRAKDDFLATVSHELRTPLNAMLGWTRLLQTAELTPAKRQHALDTIERNAVTQAQLIEDLLDVTRIVSGKMKLEHEPVALGPLVHHVLESLQPESEKKGLHIDVALDDSLESLEGDSNRIQQVLWNLVSNSIKFTPKGGAIRLTVESTDDDVTMRVVDTGVGIKPEFVPLVFERFKQQDGAITRAHRGLGLGLAISAHIVELHGGTISAASEGEGKGACFTVVLPRRRAGTAPPVASDRPPEIRVPYEPELRNLLVLVVDDEQDGRDLLTAVLQRSGATVLAAESAAEALELLRLHKPDVLVSDIGMAGTDGYDLIRSVRALPREEGGATPAAALTAYARAEDRRKALDAGYMMHLPKPVEPAELVAVILDLARFREPKP